MSKVQIKTEIDLLSILTQLDTSELETYAKEIANLLTQRKAKSKKAKITALLQQLNEDCILPEKDIERFYQLRQKRAAQELSKKELTELFRLIDEEEGLRIKRIKILGEIATLKGISISKLTKELGIKPAKRA